jgi:DNA polymerase
MKPAYALIDPIAVATKVPCLVLDFETYYSTKKGEVFSLKGKSYQEYICDPRCKIHALAVRYPDGRVEVRFDVLKCLRELQALYGPRFEKVRVLMHNAAFDAAILSWRFGIMPARITDTLLMARHYWGNKNETGKAISLKACAERLGLPPKGDIDFMNGVAELTDNIKAQLLQYAGRDAELTFAVYEKLLPNVSNPNVEFPLMHHTIECWAARPLVFDKAAADAAEQMARVRVEPLISEIMRLCPYPDMTNDDIYAALTVEKFVEMLREALKKTDRDLQFKKGKNGKVPALAKTDAAVEAMINDEDPLVAGLVKARLLRRSNDQILSRIQTMREQDRWGRLNVLLSYYGAHTGRWSGDNSVNFQNFPSEGRAPNKEAEAQARALRECVKPPKGMVLVAVDASQIEARVLAWLADEPALVEAFAKGEDIYSQFASSIVKKPVRKAKATDDPDTKRFNDFWRMVGKVAILGLGYGMGVAKFMSTGAFRSAMASGELSPAICGRIVHAYRNTYRAVPALWRCLDSAFHAAMYGSKVKVGPVTFYRPEPKHICVRLPSGRVLHYWNCRLQKAATTRREYVDSEGEKQSFEGQDHELVYGKEGKKADGSLAGTKVYGGLLTENICQAIARDVLAVAILRLERQGIPVVMTVHDEVIAVVPEAEGEKATAAAIKALSDPPSWGTGLPLAAEGGTCTYLEG